MGSDVQTLITEHIDLWASAIQKKKSAGRGSSKKHNLYGIKKLRELILELAVRGKLVPQDPNDEPASVLLERIAEERDRLVKEKKIKKPKKLSEISVDEMSFSLPLGWEFVRLNDLGEWGAGATPKRSNPEFYDGDIPWFKSGELTSDFISESEETVTELALSNSSLRYNKTGDVLLAMYGATIGKTSILSIPATTNQAVCACTPFTGFSNLYLLTLLKAFKPKFASMGAGGAQPNISREKIIATVIPLPPTAEQQRIVAKVDELMALCDKLEEQTENSITEHQLLVETLLGTLTQSQNADELAENWQRLAEHFDTLFTTEHSIDQLKQTVLQLAVMGKLVPQDPNDEPASVLLERIAAEKEQLIKDKKIKKQKALPPIVQSDQPFELPKGWVWVRLEDLVDIQSGITKGRKLAGRELVSVPYLRVANVQRSHLLLDDIKEVEIPVEEVNKFKVLPRDLLITEGGDWDKVGRTAIWANELPYVAHQNHVFKARTFLEDQNEVWLETYLNAPYARDYFAGSSKQTTNLASINKTQLRGCLIALPPSREVNRIVSKLGELVCFCDQLKARLQESQQTQLSLAEAITDQALQR